MHLECEKRGVGSNQEHGPDLAESLGQNNFLGNFMLSFRLSSLNDSALMILP
jgi:hypothetical protein